MPSPPLSFFLKKEKISRLSLPTLEQDPLLVMLPTEAALKDMGPEVITEELLLVNLTLPGRLQNLHWASTWSILGLQIAGLKDALNSFSTLPGCVCSANWTVCTSERFVPWRNNLNGSCHKMTFPKSRFGEKLLFTAVSFLCLQKSTAVELSWAFLEVWQPIGFSSGEAKFNMLPLHIFGRFEITPCQWIRVCTNCILVFAPQVGFWRKLFWKKELKREQNIMA